MLQAVEVLGERKYRVGVDSKFEWVTPHPISGTPAGAVEIDDSDIDLNLQPLHAPLVVNEVMEDNREFIITATTDTDGLQDRYGAGWLVTPHDGAFPVRIKRIDGESLFLTNPLPKKISISAASPASLQLSTYVGTVPAATVANTLRRLVAWKVTYDAQYGGNAPLLPNNRAFGLLHIVNQPFSTGLTSLALSRHLVHLGDLIPRDQNDWSPQLELGEEELILAIRQELAPMGYTEDDIPVAAQLRPAHISYTMANILDSTELDTSAKLRAQATERMRSALRLIWVDTSGDGKPTEDEIRQVTRARTSWGRGGSPRNGNACRPFRIGQHH